MCNTQKSGGAVETVLIKNDRVRVTRWDFPQPGDCTGWYRHEHDVCNGNDGACSFIEVELLEASPRG